MVPFRTGGRITGVFPLATFPRWIPGITGFSGGSGRGTGPGKKALYLCPHWLATFNSFIPRDNSRGHKPLWGDFPFGFATFTTGIPLRLGVLMAQKRRFTFWPKGANRFGASASIWGQHKKNPKAAGFSLIWGSAHLPGIYKAQISFRNALTLGIHFLWKYFWPPLECLAGRRNYSVHTRKFFHARF